MKLIESVKANVEMTERWLEEAKQARDIVKSLPKPMQELEGGANVSYDCATLILDGKQEAVRICEEAGAEFDDATIVTHTGEFTATGTLQLTLLPPTSITIKVLDVPVPPHCKVTKVEYTAHTYKAECTKPKEDSHEQQD